MRRLTFEERMDLGMKLWKYALVLTGVGGLLMMALAVTLNPEVTGAIPTFLKVAPVIGILCIILGAIVAEISIEIEKDTRGR